MNRESDKYEAIHCPEDDQYRVYCEIFDKLCIERYFKNHPKSGTHTNKFYERQQLKGFK